MKIEQSQKSYWMACFRWIFCDNLLVEKNVLAHSNAADQYMYEI